MKTKILAFSGKKQSGKNTAGNFILSVYLLALGFVRGSTRIDSKGKLWISDLWGDEHFKGEFDIERNNKMMDDFREQYIFPYLKTYSFANLLKKSVCMDVLGLTHEQCYGTDDQKNTLTHLLWENMPGIVTDQMLYTGLHEIADHPDVTCKLDLGFHEPGQMTAREVMQYVGSNIFRKM